jgi:Tol biopolymer transport system component
MEVDMTETRRTLTRVLFIAPLVLLAVTGCDDSAGPEPGSIDAGSIEVTTNTAGTPLDEDGYIVTIDQAGERAIGTNETANVSGLDAGEHLLKLTGLASNCAVVGTNPRTVTVVGGETTSTMFDVECALTTGWIQVTTLTTGDARDTDGFVVSVPGGGVLSIGISETATIGGLRAGEQEVELKEVAPNCSVNGANPRTLEVVVGDTSRVNFEVDCPDIGWLRVTTVTKGASLDADGYAFLVDGVDQRPIRIQGIVPLAEPVKGGEHLLKLTGLASNCAVNGANPRTVTVAAGETALADFEVRCAFVRRDLAFVTDRDGDPEIYAMNADGTSPVRLTNSYVSDSEPAWSPDGTTIAFRRGGFLLYLMGAGGSNPAYLREGERPTWSPDGTKIAFSSEYWFDWDIWTVNADGSAPAKLTQGGVNGQPAWSPDGTQIAFTANYNSGPEIHLMDSDGSNPVNLTQGPGRNSDPAWSPDGAKIAFTSERDGNAEIYVMDADGSNVVRLTDDAARDYGPAWSPDGTKIAFTTDRDGNLEVYVMNSDGSNPVNLSNHPAQDRGPAWAP